MDQTIVFSDADIALFCDATLDNNAIHNPEFMRSIGKYAIVPGMMTLLSAVAIEPEFLKNASSIKAYFSSMLNSGEEVSIGTKAVANDEIVLYAYRGQDNLLKRDDAYSRIERGKIRIGESFKGVERKFIAVQEQIDSFSGVINARSDIARFLFAIAYSSKALLDSLSLPQTEDEENVKKRMKGRLPAYNSLSIGINSMAVSGHEFVYKTSGETEGKRDLTCQVNCWNNGKVLYTATYTASAMLEGALMKFAKDINP